MIIQVLSCDKVPYNNRGEATAALMGIQKDSTPSRSKAKPVRIHYCGECKGWHLTSRRRRMKVIMRTTIQVSTVRRDPRDLKILLIASDNMGNPNSYFSKIETGDRR